MEDSGYFSHRSTHFNFASPASRGGAGGSSSSGSNGNHNHHDDDDSSSGRIPSPDHLFRLSFEDLESSKYRYLRHGFRDAQDFEDFKRELQDFRQLKRAARAVFFSADGDDSNDDVSDDEVFVSFEQRRRRGSGRDSRSRRSGSSNSSGSSELTTSSIKVSDSTIRVTLGEREDDNKEEEEEEEEEERVEDNGSKANHRTQTRERVERTGGEGGRGQSRTSRPASDESPPVRCTPQLSRSVSLRANGEGGTGGGEGVGGSWGAQNKRNGIYFDEDCFLDQDSQPRSSASSREALASSSRQGVERERERRESSPESGTGTYGNTPDLLLFSVPGERKNSRDGAARRVSFRETPERYAVKTESSVTRETFASRSEPGSPRDTSRRESPSQREIAALSEQLCRPRQPFSHQAEQTSSTDPKSELKSSTESVASSDGHVRARSDTDSKSPRHSLTPQRSPRGSVASSEEPVRLRRPYYPSEARSQSQRGSFASDEESRTPRQSYGHSEPSSPRDTFDLRYEPRSQRSSLDSSSQPASRRNSGRLSSDRNLPDRNISEQRPSTQNSGGQTPQRTQQFVIPIRLVDVPVSRTKSDLNTSDSPRSSRGTEPVSPRTSAESVSPNFPANERPLDDNSASRNAGNGTPVNSLPPKGPVTLPIRVEKRKETDVAGANAAERPVKRNNDGSQSKRESESRRDSFRDERPRDRNSAVGEGGGASSSSSSGGDYRPSRGNIPKRYSLLENLKRLSSHGRPLSGRGIDPFMEFFSGDEHFQEFERVFETINNHRLSRDSDRWSPRDWWGRGEDGAGKDPFDDDDDGLGVLHIDETFSDFFDNDEDFMEFERELEKIKSNRRSRLLESLSRSSSCDIFSDVKSFCDRSLTRTRTPSSSPKVERRLSAARSADSELWNSAEEWEVVMNKLKRNSRLFSDQTRDGYDSLRVGSVGGGGVAEDFVPKNSSSSCPSSSSASPQTRRRDSAGHSARCPCLRDCQYTCHLHCVPSVTLDCTTVSPGSGDGPVATPTDLPSPSASAETSLTDRRTIVSHRSPQKQQQQSTSASYNNELSAQVSPQSGRHLPPQGDASGRSSPSQNVLSSSSSSSVRDPLSGACVSQTASSSSVLSAPTVCVDRDQNQNAKNVQRHSLVESRAGEEACEVANEKDETDSGYRSGTIPDEKLPKAPSQATLNRMELRRKIQSFNHFVPKAALETVDNGEAFQGFLRVTLNLIRPITMELGARPPSIYELLTREHIVEQSTQHVAFYMPRDTVKSIHINSTTTTKEVVTNLLKKFHILDHPRKFAMYEQEFNEKNKLVKLRRLTDKDFPLVAMMTWEPERIKYYRLVLQENETGEIVWEHFSTPELNNFLIVLNREESEAIAQLQYKYRVMKRIIHQRMKEMRAARQSQQTESNA